MYTITDIKTILQDEAASLLEFESTHIPIHAITPPSKHSVAETFFASDRGHAVVRSLKQLFGSGRLRNTGYLSILPVDQGVEHTAGARFSHNIGFFDPEYVVSFAIDGGCSAIASTAGLLGLVAKRYAHRIPFVVKLNHNELLRYPNSHDQIMFSTVQRAADMGAIAVGATIYFGSELSKWQIVEVARAFDEAHRLGLATILWCYVRNDAFQKKTISYEDAADLTAQANHLGVTLGADIIKQKLPTAARGFEKLKFGKHSPHMYETLIGEHPIDLCRYQVLNCYAGKIPLISSGGPSGNNNLRDAVRSAVINKRAGGAGLIMGRKVFECDREEGIAILRAVQDVYLCKEVGVA